MDGKMILAVFAVALTFLAFGLCTAALSIPYWFTNDIIDIGLFRYCVNVLSLDVCDNVTVDMTSDNFEAIRWLAAGAGLLLGIAIIIGLLLLCLRNACLSISGCIFTVVAGLCLLVSVGLSVKEKDDFGYDYSTAFFLGCVALAFAFIAGIVFACAKPKKSGTKGRVIHPI